MRNIYILFGGNGFVGSNIYNRLVDENSYFYVIDLDTKLKFLKTFDFKFRSHIWFNQFDLATDNSFKYQLKILEKDLLDYFERMNLSKEDNLHFYHLSSVVGVQANNQSNFDADVKTTQNILNLISNFKSLANKVKNIYCYYFSSSELYGENSWKFDEEPFPNPEELIDLTSLYSPESSERSHYMYQKFIGEKLFNQFKIKIQNEKISNIKCIKVTLFNAVGPFQDTKKGIFNSLILKILNGKKDILLSQSVRRYIPISYILNCINFNMDYKLLKDLFIIGSKNCHLTNDTFKLFELLKLYLMERFPNNELINGSSIISKKFNILYKEIENRFKKEVYTYEQFKEEYSEIIDQEIDYLIECKLILKEQLKHILADNENFFLLNYDSINKIGRIEFKKDLDFIIGDYIEFENNNFGIIHKIDICTRTLHVLFLLDENIKIGSYGKLIKNETMGKKLNSILKKEVNNG